MANGIGNAWHIPKNGEPPGQASMRTPLTAIEDGTAVTLDNGNQFQGPGVTVDQTQSGSAVMVRRAGDPSFTALPAQFRWAVGNMKYFAATINSGSLQLRVATDTGWPRRPAQPPSPGRSGLAP